jgi:uncharacterized protein YukE
MRISNLEDGLGQLAHAVSELNQRWQRVREHWADDNSRHFEESHLRPIQPELQVLVSAVQNLAGSIEKAVRDLEDREESG